MYGLHNIETTMKSFILNLFKKNGEDFLRIIMQMNQLYSPRLPDWLTGLNQVGFLCSQLRRAHLVLFPLHRPGFQRGCPGGKV